MQAPPRAARGPAKFPAKTILAAGFVLLVCAAIVGLGALREIELRDAELRSAEVETANLARSLVRHADDTFELADSALVGVVHRLETEGFAAEAVSRLQGFLNLSKATLPRLRGLFVYRADGSWLATSETVNITGHNNSDRDYFKHHQASASREAFVGPPVRSRSRGHWIVTVSRRIDLPDGRFGGVVLATIDVTYFAETFQAFDVGRNGSIALISSNATLLARFPHDDSYIGHDFSGSPLIRSGNPRPFGLIRFKSALDGVERVSAFHRSTRFPFVMIVARARADILASWRADAAQRIGGVIALSLLIALLGYFLVRELAAKNRMLGIIRSKEADFRMLAEGSSDMVSRISFDGTLTYVSPSAARITGWTAGELIGRPALAGLNPDDRERVYALVEALRRGEIAEATIGYRTRHKVRGEVWLESALTATNDPITGRIDGVVCVSRDMTLHKELETRLTSMAARDGLTGLANRRVFDEQIEAQRERSRRNRSPLSLLLVDVDHFKNFNDSYGHPTGDECLRRIASALQAIASRPHDLAARYGGEEFALILPDTDAEGARVVAERICDSIRALAIPHDRSAVAGHVTVSIGGAALATLDEDTTVTALVKSADVALYAAKGAGRNSARIAATVRSIGRQAASGAG
jgi:diguanylate cyclase (GGDEF)-like protein/PAS domain S-box-containing protein